MSRITVIARRTFAYSRNLFSTALVMLVFFAVSSALFAFNLEAAENTRLSLAEVWASSMAPIMPIFAAFLAMDVWSEERRTRRVEMLMSIAVRERDLVVGKFLGVYFQLMLAVAIQLVEIAVMLEIFTPIPFAGVRFATFAPAFFALAMQGALWCAASVAFSAMFVNPVAAVCMSITFLSALPRGGWLALSRFSPLGRTHFGEIPLDACVADFSSGVMSIGTIAAYAAFTVMALFIATKSVLMLRFVGGGSRARRASTLTAMTLAVIAAVAVAGVAARIGTVLEIPINGVSAFSPRLQRVMAESSGTVNATCFLSRSDAQYRSVSQYLRLLRRQAEISGGLKLNLRFVDPNWDVAAAERIVRTGTRENAIVFEKGHRMSVLPLSDGYDDRMVISALQRIVMPPKRRDVYWTEGHGESRFDDYGLWGMSDIAREFVREGYRNRTLDLANRESIPSDCALLVVAGAKNGFSRVELGRIDSYLRGGGRLLIFAGQQIEEGLSSLLPSWGIRLSSRPLTGLRTLSGSDVIVSDFADHAVTASLVGQRIVLERPLVMTTSSAAEGASGADRIDFVSLARAGDATVAAAVERGAGAKSDIAVRPTRIVVIGDATFAMNGQLAARANANRDFVINSIAYLSGTDAVGSGGIEGRLLVTGMDRSERRDFTIATAIAFPLVVCIVMLVAVIRRRRLS